MSALGPFYNSEGDEGSVRGNGAQPDRAGNGQVTLYSSSNKSPTPPRELGRHIFDNRFNDPFFVRANIETRCIQQGARIVLRARLPQHATHNLCDRIRRAHFLVNIGKGALRIIPAFLQAEVEDDVLEIA